MATSSTVLSGGFGAMSFVPRILVIASSLFLISDETVFLLLEPEHFLGSNPGRMIHNVSKMRNGFRTISGASLLVVEHM